MPRKAKPQKPPVKGKHERGHPKAGEPVYREEYCEQAYKLCLLGATDEDLAGFFGVVKRTILNWKKKHPDFRAALQKGKDQADAEVADRLYQRAMGYEHDDEEIKVVSTGGRKGSEVVRVPVKKYYPPDPVSAIFWLKNRQRTKWRDKIDHELTGKDEGPVSVNITLNRKDS
jgi:hypothetical protein